MSLHEHYWVYKLGQGRWFKCFTCKQWGDKYTKDGPKGEVIAQTCDKEGCDKPAIKLQFPDAGGKTLRCAKHKND